MPTYLNRPFPPFVLRGWSASKLLQVEVNVGRIARPIHGVRVDRFRVHSNGTLTVDSGVKPGETLVISYAADQDKSKIQRVG